MSSGWMNVVCDKCPKEELSDIWVMRLVDANDQ